MDSFQVGNTMHEIRTKLVEQDLEYHRQRVLGQKPDVEPLTKAEEDFLHAFNAWSQAADKMKGLPHLVELTSV